MEPSSCRRGPNQRAGARQFGRPQKSPVSTVLYAKSDTTSSNIRLRGQCGRNLLQAILAVIDAVDGSSPTASQCANPHERRPNGQLYILAFAERLLLANNGHEQAFRLRPLTGVKRTWNHRCPFFCFLRPLSGVKRTLRRQEFLKRHPPASWPVKFQSP